jgi:hypothetical protein
LTNEQPNITGALSPGTSSGVITSNGGDGFFDFDWLTNLIVPFSFEFEGRKLTGTWYRYKTTTPEWIQASVNAARSAVEELREIVTKIEKATDSKEIEPLLKRKVEIEQQSTRARYAWLAESIVSWNASHNGAILPINETTFKAIPVPFLIALGDHLASTRTGQNPT